MAWVNGVWVPEASSPQRRDTFSGAYASLADICKVRPLVQWPGPRTKDRKRAVFRAPWGRSVKTLADELRRVRAKDCVLQVEIEERYFRLDGLPRVDARATGPGVVLSFTHPTAGPLMYPCDRFDSWQDNVHALALSLEALRAVDRYGVTKNAEQYRGWKSLPASTDGPMDRDEAVRVIAAESGLTDDGNLARDIANDRTIRNEAIRAALKKTHPDTGGNNDAFHRVQRARKALES